jgi:hypothetical protein
MNMKIQTLCMVVAAGLLAGSSSGADFGTITFTNQAGRVITNAVVVKHEGYRLLWRQGASGGSVRLADLPEELQRRFAFNPERAALMEAKKEELETLRRVDNALAQEEAEIRARLKKAAAQLEASRRRINGKVIQVLDNAVLVRDGTVATETLRDIKRAYGDYSYTEPKEELVMITGVKTAELADGAVVKAHAYPLGTYRYTAVSGGIKTVKKYTLDRDAAYRLAGLMD